MVDKTRRRASVPNRSDAKKSDRDKRALERATAILGKNPLLSKRDALRRVGISEGGELGRLSRKLERPDRKAKIEAPPRKAASSRQPAAAPLLARSLKKVGAVSRSVSKTGSPSAPYQPQTELAPLHDTEAARRGAVPDVLAMARPWLSLGVRMTAAGVAMQARMARAALDLPPTAAAMRHGAEAFNAWLALFRVPSHKKD